MKQAMNTVFRTASALAKSAKQRLEKGRSAPQSAAGSERILWRRPAQAELPVRTAPHTDDAVHTVAEAAKKPPAARSVLLQTYFTSLLCLVLCVTMFLGTSYAWFTSEVNNTPNEFYIGILDADLYKKTGDKEWASLSAVQQDGANTNRLFADGIRWEPGYTALDTVRVTNEGDLAFRYVLHFTDGTLAAPEGVAAENACSLENVAELFEVWVYDHAQPGGESYTAPGSYAAITAPESGWVRSGSLKDILNGTPVLTGTMDTPAVQETETEAQAETQPGTPEEPAGNTYTVALHMSDAATAEVMGYRIVLNVKLIAYQSTGEEDGSGETDGFGSAGYDNITAVSGAETLKAALEAGSANVLLTADVTLDSADKRLNMTGGILDGFGKTLRYTVEKADEEPSLGVVTVEGGTVRSLTVEGGNAGRALYSTKLTSDLLVSDCTLSGAYSFNLSSSEVTEHSLSFVNTTFKNWTSYANVMQSAVFTGCSFEDVLRPYGDTVLSGCTFSKESLDLSMLEVGETVTLENCTYSGISIDKAVLTAEDGGIRLVCESGLLAVSNEGTVILAANS